MNNITMCKDCVYFFDPYGDNHGIWYNQFCKASEREQGIDPVTGETVYKDRNSFGKVCFTKERYEYCRDINTGDCPKFQDKNNETEENFFSAEFLDGVEEVISLMNTKHVGLYPHRLNVKGNELEAKFAEAWQKENDKFNLLWILLYKQDVPFDDIPKRDVEVAATVIQWLGTAAGQEFLRKVIVNDADFLKYAGLEPKK